MRPQTIDGCQISQLSVTLSGCAMSNERSHPDGGVEEYPDNSVLIEYTLENSSTEFAYDVGLIFMWNDLTWTDSHVLFEGETFDTNTLIEFPPDVPLDQPDTMEVDFGFVNQR